MRLLNETPTLAERIYPAMIHALVVNVCTGREATPFNDLLCVFFTILTG